MAGTFALVACLALVRVGILLAILLISGCTPLAADNTCYHRCHALCWERALIREDCDPRCRRICRDVKP